MDLEKLDTPPAPLDKGTKPRSDPRPFLRVSLDEVSRARLGHLQAELSKEVRRMVAGMDALRRQHDARAVLCAAARAHAAAQADLKERGGSLAVRGRAAAAHMALDKAAMDFAATCAGGES